MPARLVLALLCALTALLVVPAAAPGSAGTAPRDVDPPAGDGTVASPGLVGYSDMEFDLAGGRLFVSQGDAGDVVVTDLDGTRTGEVPLRATSLALGPLRTTLYAALPASRQIAAVELATLDVRTYDLGAGACPQSIAASLVAVWFVDACPGSHGQVRGLDLLTGEVRDAGADLGPGEHPVQVHSEPQAPGTVLVRTWVDVDAPLDPYEQDLGLLRAYTPPVVSGAGLVPRASTVLRGPADDVALTPDGLHVVTVGGRVTVLRTADLDRAGSAGLGGGRELEAGGFDHGSVAVRSDGTVAAGYGRDKVVEYFDLGSDHHASTSFVPYFTDHTPPRSLRFGGERLYAVAGEGGVFRLHITTPPPPETGTTPRLRSFVDLEVDEPHDRVFVSQGQSRIVVTDLDGRPTAELPVGYSTDLAMSEDRRTLYAALPDSSAVAAIDTASLVVRRIELPNDVCPAYVAAAAGAVWVSDACAHPMEALHAADPDDGTFTRGLGPGGYALETEPTQPDLLVACHPREYGYGGYYVTVYRTDAGTPSPLEVLSRPDNLRCDEALRVEGSGFLRGTRTYALDGNPDVEPNPWWYRGPEGLFAQRSDGVVVMGGSFPIDVGSDTYDREIAVFRPGSDYPVAAGPPDVHWNTFWDVAAVRVGKKDAYVVVEDFEPDPVRIVRFDPDDYQTPPLEPVVRMTMDVPPDLVAGVPFAVRVHVENADPSGEVSFRLRTSGPFDWPEVARGRLDEHGDLVVWLTTPRSGDLSVRHHGADGRIIAAAGALLEPSAAVEVEPVDARRRVGRRYVYPAGAAVRLATTLTPADRRRCVTLRLQRLGAGRWVPAGTRCLRVDSRGRDVTAVRSAAFRAGRTVRLRAEWPTTNRARSGVSGWVLTRFVRARPRR